MSRANDGKGIVLPTWEEINGIETTPRVFDEFFAMDPDGEFGLVSWPCRVGLVVQT